MPITNPFMQAISQSQDRITDMLSSSNVDTNYGSDYVSYMTGGGQPPAQRQQERAIAAENQIMQAMQQKIAMQDMQAQRLDSMIKSYTGNDTDGYAKALGYLESLPEDVDPYNSPQVMGHLNQWKQGSGYVNPEVAQRQQQAQLDMQKEMLGMSKTRVDIAKGLEEIRKSRLPKQVTAQSAAGKIQSDLREGFITEEQAQKAIDAIGAPKVNVTVGSPLQETESKKVIGKELGQQYADYAIKAPMQAQSKLANLDRLDSLSKQIKTGKGQQSLNEIAAISKGLFGLDLQQLGLDVNPSVADAITSLSNQIALEFRETASGAGMPGSLSDSDRVFLLEITPNMSDTPEGFKLKVDYMRRLQERKIEVAKKMREYRKKNGEFDEAFFDELKQWSDDNPLFTDADIEKVLTVKKEPEVMKPSYNEGTVIVNKSTGERMILKEGKWQPIS